MNETNTISGEGFKAYFSSFFRNSFVLAAGVVAFALCICALIGSFTFYSIKSMDNQMSVTGSAKRSIKADTVKWTTTISRPVTAKALAAGYSQMASDLSAVKAFFAKNGFDESSLDISTISMDEVYENYQPAPEDKKYTLRQTISINSKDVEKVSALSKNTQEVIAKGVIFSVQQPEYSYSDLASLRVDLLAEALKDAQARAESIASVAGNHVGKLQSAASGVVQVLTAGSNDVSDYGTYDTSNIEKDVMVTVRASFNIR